MKKTFGVVVVILFALFWIVGLWNEIARQNELEIEQEEAPIITDGCEEFIEDNEPGENDNQRYIQRFWRAYSYDNIYCATYSANQNHQVEAETFRNKLKLCWNGDYVGFWNLLYGYLYRHDTDKLANLQDTLKGLAVARNLSRTEFANLIVSFVQDIPYELVLQEACTESQQKRCNGDVLFGIYSPAEFAYLLKGDCDTRTVLLYTLLENLGFDAVIFNSYEYAHSMLGINLPLSGDFKKYYGRNFYFWETTNVGWMPGVLPPDWSNLDYWEIVLD